MLKDFLMIKDNDIIFTGHYMEIYIPVEFFDKRIAVNMGQYIDTFGLLAVRVFNDKDKIVENTVLNLPTKIVLYPSEIETRTDRLYSGHAEERYVVCKFYKNNRVMPCVIIQNSDNIEFYLGQLMQGSINPLVPYDRLIDVWYRNMEMNGIDFGVPIATLSVLVREIYRSKNNLDTRFGVVMAKNPESDPLNYTTLNSREIASRTSVFSALTFEDPDAMLISSLNMTATGRKQSISPMEKAIKM